MCVVVASVGIVTPADVNVLQPGHCLACRCDRWCICKLPMLAPSASSSDAARVASILSIVRALSEIRPASRRAFAAVV